MSTFNELANPWVPGLMTYEPGRPIEEVARELGIEDIAGMVKLASNENAMGPSPKAVEAMTQCVNAMHLYPDGGAFYFRRELAEKLGVEMENLMPGNGSNEIIEFLGHAYLGPGVNIVMSQQAFIVYKLVASMFNAETIMVPMKGFTHDLDAMLAAITPETRMVYISNPNNPTGTVVDIQALDAFMEKVPDDVIVVIDEAYIELMEPDYQPDTIKYVKEGRNVYLLRTFSKAYGLAGLRVGYGIAPKEGIEVLNRVRQPFNVNTMAQLAARAALQDDDHVVRTRKMTKEGLAYLVAQCDAMGLEYVPSVANFMLVKVGKGREVFGELQKKGVIVRPMNGYGLPEYIRVTVGTGDENQTLMSALKEILQ